MRLIITKVRYRMRRSNWFAVVVGLGVVLGFVSFGIAGNTKVNVCHIPPDSPWNFHTISVSENAWFTHIAHGDKNGACGLFAEQLCDDKHACTIDAFIPGTESCILMADRDPVDCDDGNPATVDSCDTVLGCINQMVAAPPVPTNFSASAPSTMSVLISWDDTPSETYYELGWGPSFIATTFIVPGDTTSYLFTGLSSGISYHFDIRACNAIGCSAWHGVIGCTPSSC